MGILGLERQRVCKNSSLSSVADREDDTKDKGHKKCNLENAATFFLQTWPVDCR